MRAALRAFWGHFGRTCGIWGSIWGYFGVSLGSVWVSVGDFGSLDGYFAKVVESLWVYEGPFSKHTHLPYRFE